MLGRGTFALVERSMRVDTRLARTHLIRLGFALLMLLFLVQVQVAFEKYSAPGRDVFRSICWVNFFLLNLAGISFFSTVITEEKEEMTLGLLRMAGISPVGILMGKVTPRLLGVILLLSVQLPFTFLAITLGGVAVNQILAAYVALLSFAVLLAGRHFYGWRGRTALRWTLSGFVMLLLAYVGSRFVLEVVLGRG